MWGKDRSGNIDSLMNDQNELDAKNGLQGDPEDEPEAAGERRILAGKVDHFFSKVSVVAIRLTGRLRLGDTIEIVNGEERIRQKVSSMQIERQDITEAKAGDDVGVKVDVPVHEGSLVYVVEQE